MNRRGWLAWAASALLAGCASPGLEFPGRETAAEALGPAIDEFALSGRLAVRQGDRHDHVAFDWRHGGGRDVVLFLSPLGQGLAEITRDAAGATLVMPGREPLRTTTLGELTRKALGVSLPLDRLADWVRGAQGVSGEVDGWRVAVTETVPYRQRRLPARIDIRRDDIEVSVRIDEWGEGD